MKKLRILPLVLALALLLACTAPVLAAGEQVHSYEPLRTGDARVDYLADELLKQIPTAGQTDAQKIQTVYDWIIRNCSRDGWDGKTWFDESAAASGGDALERSSAYQDEILRPEFKADRTAGDLPGMWIYDCDSNAYVAAFAYEMMLRRSGNCAHFAALLTVLLTRLGFECRLIDGNFINNDGSTYEHKWNYVLVDGQYYWLDVRMDHAGYVRTGTISHTYFLKEDTAAWARSHQWEQSYSDWLVENEEAIARMTVKTEPWANASAWAVPYLEKADAQGLISTCIYGADMTQPMTRFEFASTAMRIYEAAGGTDFAITASFSDTYDADILTAASLGIVNGTGNGTFTPRGLLTREQAITMLGRAYGLFKDASADADALPYSDAAQIADYAKPHAALLTQLGVLSGTGDGTLRPQATLTREQALKMAVELLTKL